MFTPSFPSRLARNSGKDSKSHLTADNATGDIPSTLANIRAR